MKNLEIRNIDNLSIKDRTILGRPIVFNSRSEDLGGFYETIAPNAFGDLSNSDVRALVEHDSTKIIGRTIANTMTLSQDDEGILVHITPPATRTADELLTSIERGDIRGMSFGFTVNEGGDSWNFENDFALRTVTNANLHEITVTATPAYSATHVEVAKRSLAKYRGIPLYRYKLDLASI